MIDFDWDPLESLAPNDPCWCGSDKEYQTCHGVGPASAPGEALPPDEPGTIWLSPHTRVDPQLLLPSAGTPIFLPPDHPVSKPIEVREIAAVMAGIPAREPTISLAEIGRLRFELLEGLGLAAPEAVTRRLADLSSDEVDSLLYGTLDLAKATVDRLLQQAGGADAPTTIWVESDRVLEEIGRTLLWADHFLVNDDLFAAHPEDRAGQERAIRGMLALRPLIESGFVVPAAEELAVVLAADLIHERTRRTLEVPRLVAWVESQLVVEGPTAREVIFIEPRDDAATTGPYFFMYARVDPGSAKDDDMTLSLSSLNRYDPTFNYEPWIEQEKRNVAARLVQDVQRQRTVAESLGGHLVTRAPFRARVLARTGGTSVPASLVWADAPVVIDPEVAALADALRLADAVEDVRSQTRRTFDIITRRNRADASAMAVAADIVHEDMRGAVARLRREIERDRRWQLIAPSGSTLAALGLGIVAQPDALLVGVVAGAINLRNAVRHWHNTMADHRRQGAYALLVAQRRRAD